MVVNLIPDAERLAGEGRVNASAHNVAHTAIRCATRNLERFIRGDPIPEDRGEPIETYVEAWQHLQDEIELQMEASEEVGNDGSDA